MAAPKGRPKPKGSGRKKGTSNKLTRSLKEMTFGAFEEGGGQGWLRKQMDENPVAFLTFLGKFVPTTLAGDKENPLQTETKVSIAPELTKDEWLKLHGLGPATGESE